MILILWQVWWRFCRREIIFFVEAITIFHKSLYNYLVSRAFRVFVGRNPQMESAVYLNLLQLCCFSCLVALHSAACTAQHMLSRESCGGLRSWDGTGETGDLLCCASFAGLSKKCDTDPRAQPSKNTFPVAGFAASTHTCPERPVGVARAGANGPDYPKNCTASRKDVVIEGPFEL